MATTFLEDYLEKIRILPSQIQRNLELIKQLDEVRRPKVVPSFRISHIFVFMCGQGVLISTAELKDMQKSYTSRVKDKVRGKVGFQHILLGVVVFCAYFQCFRSHALARWT